MYFKADRPQGHYFNRLWQDRSTFEKDKDYVPSYKRPGFDESKIIHLDQHGNVISNKL
jgi:hypothetical protein